MRWELLRGIWEAGMIKLGDFTLTSGKKSPYYVDLRALPSYVELFRMAVEQLESLVRRNEPQEIGISSVELSGIPLGVALAVKMVRPFVYVRKEAKAHGTVGLVEGDTRSSPRFIVVDDVLTTGGSIIHVVKALRERGVEVRSAYVLLDRLQGGARFLQENDITVRSVTDVRSAVSELNRRGLLPSRQYASIVEYLRSEGVSI